jgi:hypothetical protein
MIDLTEHINTSMQYEAISELSGLVFVIWRTGNSYSAFLYRVMDHCAR